MEPDKRRLAEALGWMAGSALAVLLVRRLAPDALLVLRLALPLFLGLVGAARAATSTGPRSKLLVAAACVLPSLALLALELHRFAGEFE